MPLIAARTMWDWAVKLGADLNESNALVLAEIAEAVARGELPATMPNLPDSYWRHLLKDIADEARYLQAHFGGLRILQTEYRGHELVQSEGPVGLSREIMIDTPAIESWVHSRTAGIPVQEHADIPNRTGLSGRPTSWHLIEHECRRRYQQGERHSSKVGESPTEWARVLITWLGENHKGAPVPKEKTLGNGLSGLLRKLAAEARPKL
jgi:hypothetical protein